jgi:Protein of unknown function (DUF3108)
MNRRSRAVEDYQSVTTSRRMPSPAAARFWLRVMGGLCAGAVMLLVPQAAAQAQIQGQSRLDARYEATLAGIPVGKGTWTIEILDDQFTAAAAGGTAGLLKAFAGGSGTSFSQGRIVNGALVSTGYAASTTTSKKSETIRMALVNGYVKEFVIEPEPPVDADRIPVTDAQKHGVYDPMTGAILRVPGNGDLMSPDSCRTGAAIFDGRMRYDLKLDFKRIESAKADKGYQGPVLVCALYFTPVSGYIPDRPVIKYLSAERKMEIAFAPLAGTRILVPFRMTVPTPLGTAMLEATQFIATATPPRTAKTN